MSETYSLFEYLYRDASNYKVYGSVLLTGHASAGDRARVEGKLTTDGFFIPEFVGLMPLQAQLEGFPSGGDHIWHEYIGLRPAHSEEIRELGLWGRAEALVARFSALPESASEEMLSRIGLLLKQEPYRFMR
jgi:hypothetical protein